MLVGFDGTSDTKYYFLLFLWPGLRGGGVGGTRACAPPDGPQVNFFCLSVYYFSPYFSMSRAQNKEKALARDDTCWGHLNYHGLHTLFIRNFSQQRTCITCYLDWAQD